MKQALNVNPIKTVVGIAKLALDACKAGLIRRRKSLIVSDALQHRANAFAGAGAEVI